VLTSMQSWVDSLRAEMTTDVGALEQRYRTTLMSANTGNVNAAGDLTGVADQYLSAARKNAVTSLEYERIVAQTLAEVEAVVANNEQSELLKRIKELNEHAEALEEQAGEALDYAEQQIEQINAVAAELRERAAVEAEQALLMHQEALAAEAAATAKIVSAIAGLSITLTGGSSGFAAGGIAEGPTSGYLATLHGREAVIPLAKGNVPVIVSEPRTGSGQSADVAALRRDLLALGTQQLKAQRETERLLRRWETIGQPSERSSA